MRRCKAAISECLALPFFSFAKLPVAMTIDSSHTIDAIVVVAYLGLSFVIGLWARRFWRAGQEDEESFYLAGRRVPAWVNGVSYAATAINADVAPLYCGMAAVIGLPVAWFYLSRFAFAWMLVAMLFAVRWRQLGIRTGPEFYALRFGGRGAKLVRVYTALFAVAVNMVPWIGAGLLGTHKIMGPILGIDTKAVTLACIVPLVVGYVWVSGFAGVLLTDVFQAGVVVASSVVLLVMVQVEFGGPQALLAAITAAHPAEHGELLSTMPVPGHAILGPLVVFLWFVVPTIGRGGNVDLDGQRLFSCRTPREAAKVTIWGQCAMFAILMLLTLPVLGMLAKHPEIYHDSRADRERVYGMMLSEYLPTGLLGIAVAGVLASVMSTISSYMNYGAQTMVNDVLRPLLPRTHWLDPESASCLWIGRFVTLAILLCGIGVMFAADSLFRIASVIAGMFASSAAFFWAQWWWWRVNFAGWVAAMVGGPLVYISLSWLLPQWPWWQQQMSASEAVADTMIMLQALVSIVITTCLWVLVVIVTRPETDQTLKAFYLIARPLGAWRYVRDLVLAEDSQQVASFQVDGLLIGGLGVAALGAVWVALGVLGISQLVVGQFGLAATLLAGALVGAMIFKRAFRWHMLRLNAE